ncbi:inorganic diphosphatase [Candidatus Pacearchaeota archaeon]|nr:MAG: inorganic diphosphatase [Candidatus Pacearchaeota archaeon]
MENPWHAVEVGENAPREVNVIIEIPKDSKQKYELDKKTGLLKLDRFLYSAVHYPGDYGFIPQTLWEDGDPLDIIVLTNRPVYPFTLARVRVIGVIRMVDSGERDDKIVGVYECDPRFKELESIKDVPTHILAELKHFFETYKQLQGKECRILEILDKKDAWKDIEKGIKLYKLKFNPEFLTRKEESKLAQVNA